MNFIRTIDGAFHPARNLLSAITDGGIVANAGSGGYGALVGDTDIRADLILGKFYIEYFKKYSWVREITVEGLSPVMVNQHGRYDVYVDPLDGSLNYHLAENLRARVSTSNVSLPCTGVITIVQHCKTTRFSSVFAAGIADYISGDIAVTQRGYQTRLNGIPVHTLHNEVVEIGKQIVIVEGYYPEQRKLTEQMFVGQKGWLRNPGSSAYEMFLVAIGYASAHICCSQKMHESGAARLLVGNAGGCCMTFDGRPLREMPYAFNRQQDTIMACTKKYAEAIVEEIRAARKLIT